MRWAILFAALFFASPSYAETVTVDFTVLLKAGSGEVMKDCAELDETNPQAVACKKWMPLSVGTLSANALDQIEQGLKPADIIVRGSLATKIRESLGPLSITKGTLTLDVRDITLIVDQIAKLKIPPSVATQAYNILQPK